MPGRRGWREGAEKRFYKYAMPDPNTGCWLWAGGVGQETPAGRAGRIRSPYGKFFNEGRTLMAHRFSWELFNGPIPEGKLVCHRCDNPMCVSPDHLFLGTNLENTQDMVAKGRAPIITSELRAQKLTARHVRFMRRLHETGKFSQAELGKIYGVSSRMVANIIYRRAWANA